MKKSIKHIWKYITNPSYRMMIDLVAVSKQYENAWKAIQENKLRSIYPVMRVDTINPGDWKVIGYEYKVFEKESKQIIRTTGDIA